MVVIAAALALVIGLSVGLGSDDDKGTANIYESVDSANIQKHLTHLFATVTLPFPYPCPARGLIAGCCL